jgi:hypothetical protein
MGRQLPRGASTGGGGGSGKRTTLPIIGTSSRPLHVVHGDVRGLRRFMPAGHDLTIGGADDDELQMRAALRHDVGNRLLQRPLRAKIDMRSTTTSSIGLTCGNR